MRASKSARCVLVNALFLAAAETALAGSHTWDVNEVFSNADGTIQFVELREAQGTPNETGVPGHTMSSDLKSFVISGPALTAPTSNKFYLLGTAAFAALPGAPTPDATIPVGTLPFFFATSGDTVDYQPWDSFTFGSVPTNGIDSLHRLSGQAVNSPTNYAGQSGQVDASAGAPPVPALDGLGVGLVVGLLVLGGIAVVVRSRSKTA